MAERPGIMLYFDLAEPLKSLGYEGKGKLLEAMLDYGQHGIVPDFGADGMLQLAWGFLRPKLDVDAERYRERVRKNTYSSYCAQVRKKNKEPLCFNDWEAEQDRSVSFDTDRSPTTTVTPNSTTEATSVSTITPESIKMRTTNATGDGGGKGEEEPVLSGDFEEMRKKCCAMLDGLTP